MSDYDPKSNAAAIIQVAQQAKEPYEVDPAKIYELGDGGTLILDYLLPEPRRRTGDYEVNTVESFTDLVDALGGTDKDGASVWINHEPPCIRAVLNDNTSEAAGWGDLRVTLPLPLTPEWLHWASADGKFLDQEAFAEHIEDGVKELVSPDAAEMLEIAQSIHATVNANFTQAKRLDNGETQMVYTENIESKAGEKGDLTVPQTFTLAIAPFLGEDTYEVKARFKFRLGGGTVRMGYSLERPEAVILDALEQIKKRLDDKYAPAVYMGTPAAAR